jgi:hypothetical protein
MLTLKLQPPQQGLQRRGRSIVWLGSIVLLAGLLFSATLANSELYALLGAGWQRLFIAMGMAQHLPALLQQGGAVGQLMHNAHSIPAVLSYSLLYVGICIALLYLLLPQPSQRRLAVSFYGAAGVAVLTLLIGSRIAGLPTLHVLNIQLIHFVVSPLPVIMLAPLLRWYLPNSTSA